jgi:histidinol dehydrogenase
MKIFTEPPKEIWEALAERPSSNNLEIRERVKKIIERVKREGDQALIDCASEFDGVELKWTKNKSGNGLVADKSFVSKMARQVSPALKEAIDVAYSNIYKFHSAQLERDLEVETSPGVRCFMRSVPIKKVGLYVPGGSAPLFSTVLMLAIPAAIAGCENVLICTPPSREFLLHPAIAYAAQKCGVDNILFAGGAQAVAAMAYGTESIEKRDKIFGPGNTYVAEAKKIVSSDVATDMVAGPSELMVMADDSCIPSFVAADLLSQAEHGADSQVVLLVQNRSLLDRILESLETQKSVLGREEIAGKALAKSIAIVFAEMDDAVSFASLYAPEHLIVSTGNSWDTAMKVDAAGSVFIGNYSPESAGDYASGTNHTLPTNGWARSSGGITTASFMHKITYQELSPTALETLAPVIELMAAEESLDAHKNAVSVRINELRNSKI